MNIFFSRSFISVHLFRVSCCWIDLLRPGSWRSCDTGSSFEINMFTWIFFNWTIASFSKLVLKNFILIDMLLLKVDLIVRFFKQRRDDLSLVNSRSLAYRTVSCVKVVLGRRDVARIAVFVTHKFVVGTYSKLRRWLAAVSQIWDNIYTLGSRHPQRLSN